MSKKIKFNHNPELMDTIEENAKYYLNRLAEGKNAHEIAVQLYMNSLNKSEKIAESMVTEIENLIQEYHNDLGMLGLSRLESVQNLNKTQALESQKKMLEEKLDERLNGVESAKERCQILYQALLALEAYRICSDGGEDAAERAKAHVERYGEFTLSEDECAQRESQLRSDVTDAFMNTTFLANEMSDILTEIEFVETNEELSTVVMGYGEASKDYKLVLCTQAYVNAVNDMYQDLTPTTGMKEIVYATCIGADTGALASEVAKGKVEFPLFKFVLSTLGWILGVIVGIPYILSFAGMIAGLFAFSPFVHLLVFGLLFFLCLPGMTDIVGGAFSNVGKTVGNAIDGVVENILTSVRNGYDSLRKEKVEYKRSDLEKYCTERTHITTKATASKATLNRESAMAANKYHDNDQNHEENQDRAIMVQPANP